MKWLSAKTHEMPRDVYMIFRFKHDDGCVTYGAGSIIYDGENEIKNFDYDTCLTRHITHFLIPDAVEKD